MTKPISLHAGEIKKKYDASEKQSKNFCMFVLQITHQIHFESKHQSCHCQCMTNAYPHNNNNIY